MRKESLEFLERLVETPSPSGFEGPVQEVWLKRTAPFAHETRVDVHGNAMGILNPEGRPRVMLAGHCDEIGFMVKYISDDGFISFAPIGGVDVNIVAARRISIHSAKGTVPGVIGRKPIHLMDPAAQAPKKPEWHSLWIDIGVSNRKEAEKLVSLGDPITFTDGFDRLAGNVVVGRGFDDKMGSFVVSEVLRILSGKKIEAALFSVSTVQEELGLRGAKTSAHSIDPEVGIAVDVTFSSDHPDVDKKQIGEISMGRGPVIARGANINPRVFEGLNKTARASKISCQIEPSPRATGTDANVIQLTRNGVATGVVSVPNRYMHTPVEMISLKDLEDTARLLADYVQSLKPGDSFLPFGVK